MDYEILLVNDGSADRTGEIGRELEQRVANFRLVEHYPNRGYGGSLKAGFAAAAKELIAFVPADNQFEFGEITRLLDAAELWVVPVLNAGAWAYLSEGFPGYLRTNLADLNGDGVCTPAPLYPLQWPGEPLLERALDHLYLEGVDLNRNFAPHWDLGTSAESGAATPGGQKYRGPSPFSEPETQAIRDLAIRERFVDQIHIAEIFQVVGVDVRSLLEDGLCTDNRAQGADGRCLAGGRS